MNDFTRQMIEKLQAEIDKRGIDPGSIDELNKIAAEILNNHNNAGQDDFMGLSPYEMNLLLNQPLSPDCAVKFRNFRNVMALNNVPIIKVSHLYINALKAVPEIKLTAKGNIPIKLLNEINNLNIRYDYFNIRPRTELDSVPAAYGKALLKMAEIIKIRNNKMSLTKFGAEADTDTLYKALFTAFTEKFHKGYLDGFHSEETGNIGSLFAMYLLKRFGKETRNSDFYASRYLSAFPALLNEFTENDITKRQESARRCFTYRIFNKGLFLFGLVELEYKKNEKMWNEVYVRSTDLLNELFEIS